MKIKIKGEMTIDELIQTLYEKLHEAEEDLSLRHTSGATLYLNPTNGFGDKITPCNKHGREISVLYSSGAYKSAADQYKL